MLDGIFGLQWFSRLREGERIASRAIYLGALVSALAAQIFLTKFRSLALLLDAPAKAWIAIVVSRSSSHGPLAWHFS